VVIVDVSATWCLICKVNELAVLERAPVEEKLREPGVVAMRADWKALWPRFSTSKSGSAVADAGLGRERSFRSI